MASNRTPASSIALGGVMAALAVVIMCLGGLIPMSTFLCPMACMMLLLTVKGRIGDRNAWAWYGAVAILSLLMGPDKEAAAFFAFLGYYPIIKPRLDRLKCRWLWKLLYFNTAILTMYWLLLNLFGMAELMEEFREMGVILTVVTLIMGNVTFLLLDRLLVPGLKFRRFHGK